MEVYVTKFNYRINFYSIFTKLQYAILMKYYICYILTVLILLGLGSCNDSKFYSVDLTYETSDPENKDSLFRELTIKNYSEIRNILCTDKYLIIIQNCNDTIFKILDVTNDSIIACFGQVGHAKNEFSQVPFFYYTTSDEVGNKLLCVQEHNITKVIDLEKSIQNNKCILKRLISENYPPTTHASFYITPQNKVVDKKVSAQDYRDSYREKPMYIYYKGKNEEKKWEIYPQMVNTDEPDLLSFLYVDQFYVKNDGSKALSMMKLIDYITIFDFNTYKTSGIVDANSYNFDFLNDEITSKNCMEKIKIYNMAASVTDERIFILKDGRLYKEMLEASDDIFPSHLNVYNWEGKLLSCFIMDKTLWDIAYVKYTNALYGVSFNNDAIYKYKLKNE